jgi:hypothetical protein
MYVFFALLFHTYYFLSNTAVEQQVLYWGLINLKKYLCCFPCHSCFLAVITGFLC